MFALNASDRKIYVPTKSVDAYKTAQYWSNYTDDIVAYDFEEGEVVPETLKPANNEIYYTNGSTTEATTPYKTNVFGANIVSNTYDAEKECWVIKFDDDISVIGEMAFYKRSNITSIVLPNSITEIGGGAFYECNNITDINIPDGITKIGKQAFYYCSNITNFTLPNSITEIGGCAFQSCYGAFLVNCNIPSATEYQGAGFYGCRSTSITIGDNVTTIGDFAFSYTSMITSIVIPNSVTYIGRYAFYNSTDLASVYCKSITPPSGGYGMFDGNASGRKIYVPTESVDAYKSAEYWSDINYASSIEPYNF